MLGLASLGLAWVDLSRLGLICIWSGLVEEFRRRKKPKRQCRCELGCFHILNTEHELETGYCDMCENPQYDELCECSCWGCRTAQQGNKVA